MSSYQLCNGTVARHAPAAIGATDNFLGKLKQHALPATSRRNNLRSHAKHRSMFEQGNDPLFEHRGNSLKNCCAHESLDVFQV